MNVYKLLIKMKPMKKKTSKSKVVEESASTIKNYFKTDPNGRANGPNVCMKEEKRASDSKAVYVQALKDRLKSYNGEIETEKESAANECDTIQNEDEGAVAVESGTNDGDTDESGGRAISLDAKRGSRLCDESCTLLRKKYDDLKQSHVQLCLQHCELSMKYNALRKTTTNTVTSSTNDVSNVLAPSDDIFTVNEITVLKSLPLEKKKDSTFILKCIEYAYKENTSALVNKTLKGTLERVEIQDDVAVAVRPAKDPLTPDKVKRIQELFIARVTNSKCLAGEFTERIKETNINRLIASAIRNISNKEQPKNKLSQQNVNINL